MNRREQRIRRNSATRTYPVYAISASELSDNDNSIIEIKPVKRNRRHRKQPVKFKLQEPKTTFVVTGKI
jgi:hypothetical protein